MDDSEFNIERMSMIITMFHNISLATENANNNYVELQNLIARRMFYAKSLITPRDQFTDDLYDVVDLSSAQWTAIEERIRQLRTTILSQKEASARIQRRYRNHLVTAPYLEVNSDESAHFARFLYDSCEWRGSVCIHVTTDKNLGDTILAITNGIPYLFFEKLPDNGVKFL